LRYRDVDMSGRHVMITGCTAGLGRAAALEIAGMGAEMALVCRSREKGEALLRDISTRTGNERAELFVGDLGSQKDIRSIASRYLATGRPLHVLFNNAGVIMQKRTLTSEGYETTFAVNHLGYFLLTRLLLDRLVESAPARIVNTASDAHKFAGGRLDFENLQSERSFAVFKAYGASKLANILFTQELSGRLAGTGVTANAFHPGMVGSDFAKNNGRFAELAMNLLRPFARSPLRGAETGIHLATAPELATACGGYYYDCRERKPAAAGRNDGDAKRLWALSEEYVAASA
jgi:retinol dehydrogenase-12